jgi:hypothetical protein
VLAAVLAKVSAPLSKPDLILIATASLNRLPHEYAQSLAMRHKLVGSEKNSGSTNYVRLIGDHLKALDETGLCRVLSEISLLEAVTNTYSNTAHEPLDAAAKRYRVNAERSRNQLPPSLLLNRRDVTSDALWTAQAFKSPSRKSGPRGTLTEVLERSANVLIAPSILY